MTYGNLISTVTVGAGGAASIDFTSIPGTYTDLVLVVSGRFTSGNPSGDLKIVFNSTGTGYSYRQLFGNGSTVGSSSGTSAGYAGRVGASGTTASTFSNVSIYIPNYAGTTQKSYSVDSVDENNATLASQNLIAGLWTGTGAITSIAISDFGGSLTLAQYSTASLYGIKSGSGGASVA